MKELRDISPVKQTPPKKANSPLPSGPETSVPPLNVIEEPSSLWGRAYLFRVFRSIASGWVSESKGWSFGKGCGLRSVGVNWFIGSDDNWSSYLVFGWWYVKSKECKEDKWNLVKKQAGNYSAMTAPLVDTTNWSHLMTDSSGIQKYVSVRVYDCWAQNMNPQGWFTD